MTPSLDIVQIVTKPVVNAEFLQDWLCFLCSEQGFKVHLLYSEDAFGNLNSATLYDRFPGIKLHRIEKPSLHGAKAQAIVFLADYLDLKYLASAVNPALVHSHDTRSLLMARMFFPHSFRMHSWWLEDRSAHKFWRVTVERLAHHRTWETTDSSVSDSRGWTSLTGRQVALPTPETLLGEYHRGVAFSTLRELYRTILQDVDLRAKV